MGFCDCRRGSSSRVSWYSRSYTLIGGDLLNEPVIMNPSNWAQALSAIGSGLRYLDSIVLFDVPNVHLTVLGFDIAVFVFGIVWNTVGLWRYDFDSAFSDSSTDSVDHSEVSYQEFINWFSDDSQADKDSSDSEIDISAEDDDDL